MKVLLIRHAQSANNKAFELGRPPHERDSDPGITELGHRQSQALAHWEGWTEHRPDRLFCSLMRRTIETALPLAERLDLPIEARADLFECGGPFQGAFADGVHHTGTARADLAALTPRLVLPDSATDDGWWPGPVETASQAMLRSLALLDWLRTMDAGCVALVCHGAIGATMLASLLAPDSIRDLAAHGGRGAEHLPAWFTLDNTSITRFEISAEGQTVVNWVNRIDHLAAVPDHEPSRTTNPFPPAVAVADDGH